MINTLQELITNQFGIDTNAMQIGKPINVQDFNIGLKAYNEENGEIEYSKVSYIIKKKKQSCYEIKLKDRSSPERSMAGNHLIAISKRDNKVDYTFVKDLQENMKLVTNENISEIEYIKKVENDFCYDAQTDLGNYFTNNILSHNSPMSRLPKPTGGCVTLDTVIVTDESMTMEALFQKASLNWTKMEINKFYDITDKNIQIKSYNHKTNNQEKKLIKSLVYKGYSDIYHVISNGDILLKGSGQHRIFDNISNKYVFLQDEPEGECLTDTNSIVKFFVKKTKELLPIVDMEVEDNENYFSNGILSHNTALPFYASARFRITKMDTIEENGDTIGINMRVKNYKNKVGIPFRTAELKLFYKGGFDSNNEYIDFLVKFNLIVQAGSFFKFDYNDEKITCQGRVKLLAWLDSHKEFYDDLKTKVNEKLKKVTEELDSSTIDPLLENDDEIALELKQKDNEFKDIIDEKDED